MRNEADLGDEPRRERTHLLPVVPIVTIRTPLAAPNGGALRENGANEANFRLLGNGANEANIQDAFRANEAICFPLCGSCR